MNKSISFSWSKWKWNALYAHRISRHEIFSKAKSRCSVNFIPWEGQSFTQTSGNIAIICTESYAQSRISSVRDYSRLTGLLPTWKLKLMRKTLQMDQFVVLWLTWWECRVSCIEQAGWTFFIVSFFCANQGRDSFFNLSICVLGRPKEGQTFFLRHAIWLLLYVRNKKFL